MPSREDKLARVKAYYEPAYRVKLRELTDPELEDLWGKMILLGREIERFYEFELSLKTKMHRRHLEKQGAEKNESL